MGNINDIIKDFIEKSNIDGYEATLEKEKDYLMNEAIRDLIERAECELPFEDYLEDLKDSITEIFGMIHLHQKSIKDLKKCIERFRLDMLEMQISAREEIPQLVQLQIATRKGLTET